MNNSDSENKVVLSDDNTNSVVYKRVHRIDRNTQGIDFRETINKILQCVNIGEVAQNISSSTEYVVQIPAEFQKAFNSGELTLMKNKKTGVMRPILMRVADNGRNETVMPLPIIEKYLEQGNPLQDIAMGYNNLCMQQQMQQLSKMLEETYISVQRIEQGQKDDRIGLIESGREQILLALQETDDDKRYQSLVVARKSLSDGKNQIFQTLQRRVNDFVPLPKKKAIHYIRLLIDLGYLDKRDNEYFEIQEYYDLYLQATAMQAASYAVVGETEQAENVFDMAKDKIGSLDFANVSTIRYIHPDNKKKQIYNNGVEFFNVEKKHCLDENQPCDCLEVLISGKELLEVIENERTGEIPQGET